MSKFTPTHAPEGDFPKGERPGQMAVNGYHVPFNRNYNRRGAPPTADARSFMRGTAALISSGVGTVSRLALYGGVGGYGPLSNVLKTGRALNRLEGQDPEHPVATGGPRAGHHLGGDSGTHPLTTGPVQQATGPVPESGDPTGVMTAGHPLLASPQFSGAIPVQEGGPSTGGTPSVGAPPVGPVHDVNVRGRKPQPWDDLLGD